MIISSNEAGCLSFCPLCVSFQSLLSRCGPVAAGDSCEVDRDDQQLVWSAKCDAERRRQVAALQCSASEREAQLSERETQLSEHAAQLQVSLRP